MEIGISTASFFSKERTEEAITRINQLKIPVCEVFLSTFYEYNEDFVSELLDRKGDLKIYSVHTLNQQFEPELFNPMPRTRKDCEDIFRKVVRGAARLGAKYYTFHGPAKFKRVKYVLDYENIGKRVEELCDIVTSESHGTTELTYENVHWTYYNEPDYIADIAPFTRVKTCLDIKQAKQSQYSVYEYLEKMGNRLANVHLCDYNDEGKLALPGKGTFDFTRLFYTLLKNGYTGDAMIEVYPENYTAYDELAACYDYLNECLFKAQNYGGTLYE
ncbi:MAG TPA: sugar phosphate isomerase/epimerase [Clostridia bacterium]|jgi:sugar phosphate isomerase/epimerase|nr:sugar phosphate isomerase/epimerase [Clostridia bacterium]